MTKKLDQDWIHGRASLGAAAGWTPDEMRLVAELGYALSEQGRQQEALEIFEGLAALAPATGYFQSALGALKLRAERLDEARLHLDAALAADPNDWTALANRGEVLMLLGDEREAIKDLRAAVELADATEEKGTPRPPHDATRARALLALLTAKPAR